MTTVRELITRLQHEDPDAEVCVAHAMYDHTRSVLALAPRVSTTFVVSDAPDSTLHQELYVFEEEAQVEMLQRVAREDGMPVPPKRTVVLLS